MGYGINCYHKTASIYVDYAPFWVFWLDDISGFLCNIIPHIPLPPIPIRLFNKDTIEFNDGEKWTTLKGDLSGLFHIFIHCPILYYCFRKTDGRTIAVGFNKLRKAFYDKDKNFWEEHEEILKDNE